MSKEYFDELGITCRVIGDDSIETKQASRQASRQIDQSPCTELSVQKL